MNEMCFDVAYLYEHSQTVLLKLIVFSFHNIFFS